MNLALKHALIDYPGPLRDLARSYIDLLDLNRVCSFVDWCKTRGGFLPGDKHRIKSVILKFLKNRPCCASDFKKDIA